MAGHSYGAYGWQYITSEWCSSIEVREKVMNGFWKMIEEQCHELTTAKSANEVVSILNKYGPPSSGDAFFAGSGGDTQVMGCLSEAGWTVDWAEADYYWVMRAPDGSLLSYVEGDVYLGDTIRAS